MMSWCCRRCWRTGEIIFEMPEAEARRQAERDHRHLVDLDMRAGKVPAGCEGWRNAEIMEKYPGSDCAGDILIGGSPVKRTRFDKTQAAVLNFEGESL